MSQIRMALCSVHSDGMFCEQLDYNLLFRWFLDMSADGPVFAHSTFTKP
jgi:transposase